MARRLPLVARVITGGQSGADRAATDVAEHLHVPFGGWVPKGGWAEDAAEPPGVLALYGEFAETESADPAERTVRNASEADATLLFVVQGVASPGSDLTRATVTARGVPLIELDPMASDAEDRLRTEARRLTGGCTLNVAGPRESECPGVYDAVRGLLLACADLLF